MITDEGAGGGAADDPTGLHVQPPGEVQKHLAAAEAALMLVESLMLALIERRVLSAQHVIEAVETVIETKRQFVAEGSHPGISAAAAGLVSTIANSLAATAEASSATAGVPSARAEKSPRADTAEHRSGTA